MIKSFIVMIILLSAFSAFGQDTTRLSLLFLGDIMQHDSQITDAYDVRTGAYDYHPCFEHVKPYSQPVDVAIGNLELTLAGPPYKGYPQFSAPDQLLVALKDIGMDVLVTANNHCVDRGKKGLERTIRMLDSLGIPHTGTFVDEEERSKLTPLLIEKNGFRLALLNYTYGTNGLPVYKPNIVNLLDTVQMKKDLLRARELKPDATIVFTHWGSEYESLPNTLQKNLTAFCFRNGAQIVIGAHPHVIQPMQWDKGKNQMVVYSLGNFVSGQRKRFTDGGAMVRIELEKVKLADNVTATGIDTAGYILQWVHRTADSEKNYFIYPVPTVEKKIRTFVRDETSVAAFRTFIEDSRALLGKHNVNFPELNSAPEFDLEISGLDTLAVRRYIEDGSKIEMLQDSPIGKVRLGPFTLPDAKLIQLKLTEPSTIIQRKDD
jgi:poly-gamma-glutamate capsule biosynthesis protein CapA/YwtB (metallophosphatase superfamily)